MATTTVTPLMEHKSLFGAETKVLTDEGEGIVQAIVSVTGIVDEVKDIIVPGAYAKTLAARKPKGVDAHDWSSPVSKPLDIKELMPGDPNLPKFTARGEPWPREAGALMVKAQFNLNTARGRDAYEDVKFFEDEQEWSIGYNVPTGGARIDHKKGIRYIDALDLFEYSTVLFGAMPLAGTHSVKALGGMIVGLPLSVKGAKVDPDVDPDDDEDEDDRDAVDEDDMEHKGQETAYLSPSELAATADLRRFTL